MDSSEWYKNRLFAGTVASGESERMLFLSFAVPLTSFLH